MTPAQLSWSTELQAWTSSSAVARSTNYWLLRCCLGTTVGCRRCWADCRPDTRGAESVEDRWRTRRWPGRSMWKNWLAIRWQWICSFCLILYSFVNNVHNKASRLYLVYKNLTTVKPSWVSWQTDKLTDTTHSGNNSLHRIHSMQIKKNRILLLYVLC